MDSAAHAIEERIVEAAAPVCPRCLRDGRGERALGAGSARDVPAACRVPACGFAAGRTPGGAAVLLPGSRGGSGHAYYDDPLIREQYLAFHFPDPAHDPLLPLLGARTPPLEERFPFALASLWSLDGAGRRGGLGPRRALDLGCAVGGATFLLARDHDDVLGLDLSPLLIDAATEVARNGAARYQTVVEGEVSASHEVPIDLVASRRARFLVADALAVPFASRSFDTVIGLNLLDRVPDPARALGEMARLVRPEGLLIVASPYTWSTRFTPRERWLGGHVEPGRPARGADAVRAALAGAFGAEHEVALPFFIPHHARSGQLGLAVVQTFRRIAP